MRTWFSTRPLLSRVAALLLALLVVAVFVVPAKAYVLTLKRWPTPNTTYSFSANYPNDKKATAREAELNWAEGAVNWGGPDYTFRFDEVGSGGALTIAYGESSNNLPDIGNALAYTFVLEYGPFWKEEVFLVVNPTKSWVTDSTPAGMNSPGVNKYSLRSMLRHELGHAAGVGHSQDSNAMMFFSLQQNETSLPVSL